jgi:hypothetical protein
VRAAHLVGALVNDCGGRDVRVVAVEYRARIVLEPLAPTPGQALRWESGEEVPWPEVPDVRDYRPTKAWQNDPATEGQIAHLKHLGFKPLRPLTKGEARYLIGLCWEMDRRYPTPATPQQASFLWRRGEWREGMSKREATRVIAGLSARAS